MTSGKRHFHSLLGAVLLVPMLACSGEGEEDDVLTLPPPPTFGAQCTNGVAVPPSGSVSTQCASVSGDLITVNLLITDTGSEQVVAAALDLSFSPPIATFQGCTLGSALGSPAEVQLLCGLANNNPAEILVSVVRQSQSAGVTVSGSQILATLSFRISGAGTSALTFLGQNAANGSALLRRDPLDPTQTQIIPGIVFPAGVTISSS